MSLQMRFPKDMDDRMYSPAGDLAHNFQHVVTEVVKRSYQGGWPALDAVKKEYGVTDADIEEACLALVEYVKTATQITTEKMLDTLTRCGWYKTHAQAQLAVMALVGSVITGMYFRRVREATLGGKGPCDTCQDLVESSRELFKYMRMSRFRRFLLLARNRVRKVVNALLGK